MHQHAKKQFIPLIHSWDTVQTGHVLFLINFEFMRICITMQKKLINWFVKEIWMIKNSCNLMDWEHFGQYLRNKIFSKYGICARTHQILYFMAPFYGWGSTEVFTFYYKVPKNPWYLFDWPWKAERLGQPWSHPEVLNTGPK